MKNKLFVMTMVTVLLMGQFTIGRAQTGSPVVVSIEVRFIEAPRTEIDRLAPNTNFIMKAEALQQLQKLIDKKQAAILAQPRIITVSGFQVQVKSVRELIYPSEYDTGALHIDNSQGTNVNVQIVQNSAARILFPTSFKTRELGTILSVTPTVGADLTTVNLALTPEVSLLSKLGFVKHTTVIPAGKSEVSQPDVFSWSLSTSLVMKSGSTGILAILEPNPDRPSSRDNVVLVLVTAAVCHIE